MFEIIDVWHTDPGDTPYTLIYPGGFGMVYPYHIFIKKVPLSQKNFVTCIYGKNQATKILQRLKNLFKNAGQNQYS